MRIVTACVAMALALRAAAAAPTLAYSVVARWPHDATAFTEGLAIADGRLYESCGLYGQSRVTVQALRTNTVLATHPLPDSQFGEGLTIARGQVVQLTWREGLGYVYDRRLRVQSQFPVEGQGWGLAWDGASLIQSDGSSVLRFLDPDTAIERRRVTVHDGAQPVAWLNELEAVHGWLLANVWHRDRVAVIDPRDGAVRAWFDLSALRKRFPEPPGWDAKEDVLNGIAFDAASGHLFVTGKRWPWLFELAAVLPSRPENQSR